MTWLKHFLGMSLKRFPTLLNPKTEEENPSVVKGLLIGLGLKKKKHTLWPWEIWTKLWNLSPQKTDQSVRKKYFLTVGVVLCVDPVIRIPRKKFSPNGPSKKTPRIGSLIFVVFLAKRDTMFGRCWCWKKNNRKNSISRKQTRGTMMTKSRFKMLVFWKP